MSHHNVGFASALLSTLASLGLGDVCISPGSRNAPLIAAVAANPALTTWVIADERSAGFFALGLATAARRPVALISTSGTAAAEYHPALVEAHHAGIPLLALTADRPPELRGVGAPQTIDQVGLFGTAVKLALDAPPPGPDVDLSVAARIAADAWIAATSGYSGPVHLNLPFREPLLDSGPTPEATAPSAPIPAATPPDVARLVDRLSGKRGLIVAGRSNEPGFPAAAAALARKLSYPVIADPLSGLRHGPHSTAPILAAGDALAAAGTIDRLRPEVVVRFGPVPTSKATWRWLEMHRDVDQILVDVPARDATHSATTVVGESPALTAAALAAMQVAPAPEEWAAEWARRDRVAMETMAAAIAAAPFPNEPAIAAGVLAATRDGAILTAGSSMPIRDVDTFGGTTYRNLTIVGNRGASGIDGLISTALGTAAVAPAVALVGDVGAFHDLNAIATAARLALPLTIVVVNNDGGGIFHFLPHRGPGLLDEAEFERFLGTPHGIDFVPAARALGVPATTITSRSELHDALQSVEPGPRLLQLRTDREANVELHHSVAAAVAAALELT
jgi:2-succinyl-5-enolpyruvyl-6-hydroxy-3-cyclohexene-1-carboxylate synthase